MRALIVCAGLCAALAISAAARAGEINQTIEGHRLRVSHSCAASVRIDPKAGQEGRIAISARADHAEELEHLSFAGGDPASVQTDSAQCWADRTSLFAERRTLRISIQVPKGMAIEIDEAGSTDYEIGDVGGAVTIDASGSGKIRASSAAPLKLRHHGSGNIEFGAVADTLDADITGSGNYRIEQAELRMTDIAHSGSGAIEIRRGALGRVKLAQRGSGHVALPGLSDASVAWSSSGDLSIATVTGTLSLHSSGSGNLEIRQISSPNVELQRSGSGSAEIGGGTIGVLKVANSGSGGVKVAAKVGDAEFETSGSGHVSVAEVTGHVTMRSNDKVTIGQR